MLCRYLSCQGLEVVTCDHRYEALPRDVLVESVRESECPWILNALGRTKQKSSRREELYRANTLFPLQLKSRLLSTQRLIHASTDCVFSGKAGPYSVDSVMDADDVYGVSKSLAEVIAESDRCYIVRTSIIGPEVTSAYGLMGWFLAQRESVVGFANHRWNGLTTLEWAKLSLEIMRNNGLPDCGPLIQTGFWPPVTKAELLELIGRVWSHPIRVQWGLAPEAVDRTLRPAVTRAHISQQLRDLRRWYDGDGQA